MRQSSDCVRLACTYRVNGDYEQNNLWMEDEKITNMQIVSLGKPMIFVKLKKLHWAS